MAVIEHNNKQTTCYEAADQEIPKWKNNLCTFDDARVIKIRKDGKLETAESPTSLLVMQKNIQASSSGCLMVDLEIKSKQAISLWLNKIYF